ncbi:efflux RND transporter periplasmic adaptor subunit [Desulfovibrio inopinatus]|uniref:efflux RND transporter periplasmic adaptor subunit n=1 Tax=Desulfovibrio inopinatus TaxID=102109 RepID=UPI0004222A0F|nr:efflux RND transporter periplasmic adaptor subunit [Desulfovibrio inopinatus]
MKTLKILVFVSLCLAATARAGYGQDAPAAQAPAAQAPVAQAVPETARPREIIFSGKLYSPHKQTVNLNYTAYVKSIKGNIGTKVKKDDTLVTFEIPLDTRMAELQNVSLVNTKNLEYQIEEAENQIENYLIKQRELEVLLRKQLTSPQSLEQNKRVIDSLRKKIAMLKESYALERSLSKDRLEIAQGKYGSNVSHTHVPENGFVKSPMDGYILWMNADLKDDMVLASGTKLYEIGAMDPLVLRAEVHEIEAQKLTVGDKATVTFDSVPGRTFGATVTTIPWAPLPSALQQPSYYQIELTLPNTDLRLKEGLKGQVTIIPGQQG